VVCADAGRSGALKTEKTPSLLPKEAAMSTQSHAHHPRHEGQIAEWIEDAAVLAMLFSAAAALAAIVVLLVVF
jgi:hypothetical protein